jgi:hypothetical protein
MNEETTGRLHVSGARVQAICQQFLVCRPPLPPRHVLASFSLAQECGSGRTRTGKGAENAIRGELSNVDPDLPRKRSCSVGSHD